MSAPLPAGNAGGPPKWNNGGHTFQASVTIPAGSIVEPDPNVPGKIRPAAAGSKTALGYATVGGYPPGYGNPLSMVPTPNDVAVERNCVGRCSYAADAKFGDPLVTAANGTVTPAGSGADASTIVGQCYEPSGAAAGSAGWTWVQ